jgi:hypothetical protein
MTSMQAVTREEAESVVRRLLANGKLTLLPKRPRDQEVVAALAAARFDPGAPCSEAQVNEVLAAWLESLSEPDGIDHVTMRRMLVDMRLLVRTSTGSSYGVAEDAATWLRPLAGVEPTAILASIAGERSARKERHSGSPPR